MPDREPPHFHLESTGDETLRGWALRAGGHPFVDMRIREGDLIHPVVYGFPRSDLSRHFGVGPVHLPAGFEARLALSEGIHTLVFEACDINGEWRTLHTHQLRAPAPNPAGGQEVAQAVWPHEFARMLQLGLRRSATLPPEEAARSVADTLPRAAVTRYAPHPFHGHLHQPALLERALFGRLCIEGWLFHETLPIKRVLATADLQAWQTLPYGGQLPYVATLFPQHAAAQNCRIHGLIDVPAQLPSPLSVRLYAELGDGTWHLCQVQQAAVFDLEEEKAPFAPYGIRRFITLCRALLRALRQRGLTVKTDRLWWRGVRGVWREYRAQAPRATPLRPTAAAGLSAEAHAAAGITLVTHNLNYEGAPLFLLELARHLAEKGNRLRVITASNGPLREAYAALGATILQVDITALQTACTVRQLRAALQRLSAQVSWSETDLVIANTLSTYWGVQLAHLAHRPSLFYIHESTTPGSFYLGHLPPALLPVVEETFALATHVSFLTEATRRYYRPYLTRGNHSLNAGWINLAAIDAYLASHPRDELRRALGIEETTRLVINVGTVCDRKGQHIFARAVDQLWRHAPEVAASCRFVMVGGRQTLFDDALADLLHHLDRPNLTVVGETGNPLSYYASADLFVCSSYEESFPRVILEAMACRLPILSTNVHGIPEMVRPLHEGLLVPPGNTMTLAQGVATLLRDPASMQIFAQAARQRVVEHYDSRKLLRQHAALIAAVAGASPVASQA